MVEQGSQVGDPAFERIVVSRWLRLVREPAAYVVGDDTAKAIFEASDQSAVVVAPGRVVVEHDDRVAAALVKVVQTDPAPVEEVRRERVRGYHLSPNIMQFSPLPMPMNPTRSPGRR